MYEFRFIENRFINEIINKIYNGDISRCAGDLNLPKQHFMDILHQKSIAGIQTLKAVIIYCSVHNIDFKRYVEITEGDKI